jgi:hypothetical protein
LSVATYGSAIIKAGQVAGVDNAIADGAILAVSAIANGPLCTAALNGGTVQDPLALIANIGQTIANVENVTNGKVTAAAATSPAVASMKMQRLNDKLRFKLYGLKHRTTLHYN